MQSTHLVPTIRMCHLSTLKATVCRTHLKPFQVCLGFFFNALCEYVIFLKSDNSHKTCMRCLWYNTSFIFKLIVKQQKDNSEVSPHHIWCWSSEVLKRNCTGGKTAASLNILIPTWTSTTQNSAQFGFFPFCKSFPWPLLSSLPSVCLFSWCSDKRRIALLLSWSFFFFCHTSITGSIKNQSLC